MFTYRRYTYEDNDSDIDPEEEACEILRQDIEYHFGIKLKSTDDSTDCSEKEDSLSDDEVIGLSKMALLDDESFASDDDFI